MKNFTKGWAGRLGLLLVLIAAVVTGWTWYGPGPAKKDVVVTVPQGAALQTATDHLFYAGAIGGPRWKFYYLARLLGGGLGIQAGEFEIPARSSYADILTILQKGQPIQRLVTIPEGWPSVMVMERVAGLKEADGDAPLPAEGAVLPDSYTYARGETRAAIIGRMTAAMDEALKEEWAKKNGDCPVSTPREAVILASIVEKETGKPSERRMVAGVYCNRLKLGMKLDADPTVIYPITKGKPLGRRILRSELDTQNGYNTYRMAGLPAGPIANPGRASIAAVLNPEKTDAVYFVADGSGGHVFASTLSEHNTNVAKWRAFRKAKGI
ncbi:MAG: endolytic transglycosylase MltG [Sphingomicrobium sp.]